MASTYLTRTSGTPTNALKWTFSTWVKIASIPNDTFLLDFHTDTNNRSQIGFAFSTKSFLLNELVSNSTSQLFISNRKFRDNSAWLHLVVSCDRTLATAGDRTKIYFNGVRETSWSTQTNPAQNTNGIINTAVGTLIGKYSDGTLYFNGSMSHINFCDGYAYDASTFGESDSVSGIWKPKTAPSVTYGNNGFFLKFENSGAMGTDSSGESNTFTVGGGTLTQNLDTPSNNFACLNNLAPPASGLDIRNGNTHVFNDDDNNAWQTVPATLGITPTAKIYWEIKCVAVWGSGSCEMHGIADLDTMRQALTGQSSDSNNTAYAWRNDAGFRTNGSTISGTTWAVSYTTNDILMFALDNANGALYAGKNGTWLNSGNPTSGASKTGALSVTAGLLYAPHSELKYGSDKPAYNFGNGNFVTTAVTTNSGAGYQDADGNGKMNYTVPSGYRILSTKGLNSF